MQLNCGYVIRSLTRTCSDLRNPTRQSDQASEAYLLLTQILVVGEWQTM